MSTATVTIEIDGRHYEVAEGANLLAAVLGAGLDLPYFCWHPALGSVGACRQCAVKQYQDDDDTDGRIAMACMTPVADGARFSIDDPEARRFRQGVVEMLMANHPHDCPVCEEGGECHLQDVTVMTGQVLRRYRGPKRTHRNQDLGPFLNHEMNRCIACYRCVRFYRDYAGGRDLDAFASREQVYFGRAADGAPENPFAGNLAEVCPTGVFTDRSFSAHYARKWDLQCAPSICVHCALGCNTSPGVRDGTLRRIVNRYHGEVNGYFLCDRGRFGYDFANHAALLRAPRLREAGGTRTLSADEALALLAGWLGDTRRVIGIGSPRASLESNFALRALVGAEAFHCGLAGHAQRLIERCLARLRAGPATASLREVEAADAAFVLGEDPTGSAPRLALALRQAACAPGRAAAAAQDIPAWHDAAVRAAGFDAPYALHVASPAATELDDVAASRWHGAPDDLARLGLAVAHAIDPAAPPPPDADAPLAEHAERVATALAAAERPLVVAGTALGSAALIDAGANVARALQRRGRDARLVYTFAECNDAGAALLGGAPLEDALAMMAAGEVDLALVVENDLFRRAPQAQVSAALAGTPRLVVFDHLDQATARAATLALRVGHFAESSGTLVSSEGRAQRFFAALAPQPPVADAWRWLGRLRRESGVGPAWRQLDALLDELAEAYPAVAAVRTAAPDAAFRIGGARIARTPQRASGRTALNAAHTMFEPPPPRDKDSPLAYSMEGRHEALPPALTPFAWAPGWNSVQAVNKFQAEIGGPLAGGDPGVRLIAPAEGEPAYLADTPPPFAPRAGQWLLLPLPQVFGSEELSALAPAVAERAGAPALVLGAEDATALGLVAGACVTIETGDQRLRLPLRIAAELPPRLAGLPAGVGECAGLPLPAWGRLLPEDGR